MARFQAVEGLTDKQRATLNFIDRFNQANKRSPTYQEVADAFGIRLNAALDRIRGIIKKGYLRENRIRFEVVRKPNG